jgi:branched-chain amino acid transport system substrate-binding protein
VFTGEPIRLGLQAPLTGPQAAEGLAIMQAVLHDGSPAAARLADGVQQAMARQGAQIVAYEAVSPNSANAPPLLEKLTTANPGVVYVAGSVGLAAPLMKQARDAGVQVVWVLSNGANTPELASLIGPRGTTSVYVVADPLPRQLADPPAQSFAATYQAAFNAEPTLWSAMAADAVALVQEAVRATNSADPQVLASYLHDRLRDTPGITGQIEGFDSAGNRLGSGDVVLVLTPDGRLVPNQQQP